MSDPQLKRNKCNVPNCTETMTYLPFKCKYCGKTFCKKHRLPENHNCTFSISGSVSSQSQKASQDDTSNQSNFSFNSPNIPSRSSDTSQYSSPDVGVGSNTKDDEFQRQLDKEMREYFKKHERETSIPRSHGQVRSRTPFISRALKPIGTYWLIGIVTVFYFVPYLFSLFNIQINFFLNITTLVPSFFIPLISSMFSPSGIINFIFAILILYTTGRMLELRYGTKFIVSLYVAGGIAATFTTLFVQFLGLIFTPLSFLASDNVSSQWGAIMAIFTFIIYLAGLERPMRFILFFIPVQMKGKTMLYILIGSNLIFLVLGLILGLLGNNSLFAVSMWCGQLASMYVGKYFFDHFGNRTPMRFY
ncbi:MAG: rhomboid family intramembrane serine protease [Promethearchaeota archaeon]